jgi:Na+/H+-dicarboxylate symporter
MQEQTSPTTEGRKRLWNLPLYAWVLIAVAAAIPVGMAWGEGAVSLEILPRLIIRALTALAAPLVVLAILSTIVTNEIHGRQGVRMMIYYLLNTLIAIAIALALSNLVRPGRGVRLVDPANPPQLPPAKTFTDLVTELIPKSIGEAFAQNNLAQLVVLTLALSIALARIRDVQVARGEGTWRTVMDFLNVGFEVLMKVLLWIVALVPLAVFGVVAWAVGRKDGLEMLASLVWLVVVVVAGLAVQVVWYLFLVSSVGRRSPIAFLRGARNAMAAAFSSASTGATMPITLGALTGPLKVSRASSQLAACVGTNFNNDGTALYQAAAVLFMAQSLGLPLTFGDQMILAFTTIFASIGAGCIPSGSFVTLPLIFAAVRLPADKIPLLLTIDWFLDRCRTTCNVLGDMTVAVMLDRTEPSAPGRDAGAGAPAA